MPRVLLLTGDRELAFSREAADAVRSRVAACVRGLDKRDVVLTCGALGVGEWAAEAADDAGLKCVEFRENGLRYEGAMPTTAWSTGYWLYAARGVGSTHRAVHLAAALRRASEAGWTVAARVYAAPWERCGMARDAAAACAAEGVRVEGVAVPAELAPKTPDRGPEPPSTGDLVFIDTETTGVSARDRVIEVGMVRYDAAMRSMHDRWTRKVALPAGVYVHPDAAAKNGYTPEKWAGAVSAHQVMEDLSVRLPRDFTLVGHNLPFDLRMLDAELMRLNRFPLLEGCMVRTEDTKVLAGDLKRAGVCASTSLDVVCAALGIRSDDAHGALADAERCAELYRRLKLVRPARAEAA